MKASTANKIYDVLVADCGATENLREGFVHTLTHERERMAMEFRFCGNLGFGGKFYWDSEWRVSCYEEDETPARRISIEAANDRIKALQHPIRRFCKSL